MAKIRRKGVALVESSKGVLVVAGRSKKFTLPGGGANAGESRQSAAIRELYEETGLKSLTAKYLLSYTGSTWKKHNGTLVKNHAKVFVIKAQGVPHPRHEIRYIAWVPPKSAIRLSERTKSILKNYWKIKE